ncbi:hypothetical protein [Gilliamella sp. wkB308]|uniref:hypothetical protein n=1 Tax=Gilliamella sp. wkB308 TaxID=3120263 RepID=UPI00080E1038|nr:hypothetical protein [Gilliamella apicola]OCF98778.1 hypothetical protein A9G10_06010 [Gilliamella apicola]
MSGRGIGRVVGKMLGPAGKMANELLGGGSNGPAKIVNNITPPQDTAQEEVDKKQMVANAALARKKNRSLLSTGATTSDVGTAQVAKKLLGE